MMKQTLFIAALTMLLGLGADAMAEKIKCAPQAASSFTVDVPQGWTSRKIAGGCVVGRKDGSQFIGVAYYNAGGLNAKDFAAKMCAALKVTPEYDEQEDDNVSMNVTVNGSRVNISILSDDSETVQVLTRKPDESEELDAIFDSVTF